ncbi:ABC transporter substrate-binding protein [Intrasporangium calvum]|uniref:ABC transporter substrate-binding protein n=1 Tax=Intrasporangium calvum TaxID=53358 RepID=A0ABT5GMB0_9MICO|nr:ABC transporter substrate-binding protein [Intrasporangium calvum]MDC5699367.1 ABC transporter substrate-binding protein [Intrasporangium calvum]
MIRTRTLLAGLLAAAVLPLAACGSTEDPLAPAQPGGTSAGTGASGSVTIGSADFPESALLGEIYAQALEAKGITVQRQFNIGNRETYLKALEGGEVDILPEYTGSLTNYYDSAVTATNPDEVYETLKSKLPSGFTVLAKSTAEDKNSMVVTKETADAWSLKAIPDLAAYQDELTIAAPPEFRTRQQGLVGLKEVYNLEPKEFRPLASQATVEALKNGQVKAANIFSTDPSIAANGFVVLEDPKLLFGSDNVVPLVREEVAGSVQAPLDAVSAKLDTTALADMVKQVVVDKKDASVVAKEWLTASGLL